MRVVVIGAILASAGSTLADPNAHVEKMMGKAFMPAADHPLLVGHMSGHREAPFAPVGPAPFTNHRVSSSDKLISHVQGEIFELRETNHRMRAELESIRSRTVLMEESRARAIPSDVQKGTAMILGFGATLLLSIIYRFQKGCRGTPVISIKPSDGADSQSSAVFASPLIPSSAGLRTVGFVMSEGRGFDGGEATSDTDPMGASRSCGDVAGTTAEAQRVLSSQGPAAPSRRHLLVGGVAAASTMLSSCEARATAALAMSRDEAVAKLLSPIPVFIICNKDGKPYLTDNDTKSQKRSGSIFLGIREAAKQLEEVRDFDFSAALKVLTLSSVYSEVAKSTAELQAQLGRVPQPESNTSTDMRLFRLRQLADERQDWEVDVLSAASAPLGPGNLPLYYAPNLFLTLDEKLRRPYFFRAADLAATWANRPDFSTDPKAPVSQRVVGVEKVLEQLTQGDPEFLEFKPILVAASESVDFVKNVQQQQNPDAAATVETEKDS